MFASISLSDCVTIVAVAVAAWAIRQNKNTAKVRNTLEFMQEYNRDRRVEKAHKFLLGNKDNSREDMIANYKKSDNRTVLLFLLNQFEILAVGLRRGIYDRAMIEKIFDHDIYKVYGYSEKLIDYIRHEEGAPDPTAYKEYEDLAVEMRNKYQKRKTARR